LSNVTIFLVGFGFQMALSSATMAFSHYSTKRISVAESTGTSYNLWTFKNLFSYIPPNITIYFWFGAKTSFSVVCVKCSPEKIQTQKFLP
jgi:hypothetical protein